MKKEYPDLLEGCDFRDTKLSQLRGYFVEPFNESTKRQHLVDRFEAFMRRFHQLGLSYELWIDGSFTTEKEEPKDIDAVFFVEETELVQLDQQAQEEMVRLFHRDYKQEIMIRYNCDVYLELTNDQGARRYWKKQFGTYRDDQTPKGIARIESATQ